MRDIKRGFFYVKKIDESKPAYKAGIRVLDIIHAVDQKRVGFVVPDRCVRQAHTVPGWRLLRSLNQPP